MRCIFDIRYMLYANVICSTLVHKKANLYLKSWVMIQSCYCQKSRFIQNINLCNIKLELDVRYLSWAIDTRSKNRSYGICQYSTIPYHLSYWTIYFDFYNDPIHMVCDEQVIFKKTGILKKNFLLINYIMLPELHGFY